MADSYEKEKQEYIKKLVNISRERAKYVGIDHAALDLSDYALKAAEDRLETIKCKGLTDCSLAADAKINA